MHVIYLHSHPIKAVSADALGHKDQMEIPKAVTTSQISSWQISSTNYLNALGLDAYDPCRRSDMASVQVRNETCGMCEESCS